MTQQEPTRVAIIGTSRRSLGMYGPILKALPDIELVAAWGRSDASARRLGASLGVPAYMVDAPEQVRPEWIAGKRRIGLTAGASAPEALAQSIVERLRALGARQVRPLEGIQ